MQRCGKRNRAKNLYKYELRAIDLTFTSASSPFDLRNISLQYSKSSPKMYTQSIFFLASLLAGTTAQTYKASFTEYGTGDQNGSPNCNTASTACGFYTSPGYSAAVSQNFSGNTVSNAGNSIVVKVTNLCPADGNPLCAQATLSDTNQYGANVNFDSASAALFGSDGVGLGVGTAEEVDCSEWSGTVVD
ncbi:MAG: glycoside hydrolase family 45 protein [Acidomyces sp. 'richmondensis']|nr:MAG: glycoside hydrolase family 45 protein [Acidomyces sp. 'richmondensis']